jgi:hypothetical protein
MSQILPMKAVHASNQQADSLLKGVCDLHIHKEHTASVLEIARQAREAGYKAVMLKPGTWPCHEQAYLVQHELPGFQCFSSLVMNLAFGNRVNVYAAEQAIRTVGNPCRCIWMPTRQATYPPTVEANHPGPTIPVVDASGRVLPEVVRVMEICAEAGIIFASGHSSPEESLILARKAKDVGVNRFVITHANSRIWKHTHDQIKEAVDLGAYIEYCYLPRLWGPGTVFPHMPRQIPEEFVSYIRLVPERSFVSTDLGARGMPEPVDGMRMCVEEMIQSGVPQQEIDLLIRTNPAKLLGI